jgi:hypothetical protein
MSEGIELPLLILQKISDYIKLIKHREKMQEIINELFRPPPPNIIYHNQPQPHYTYNHDIYCYDNSYHNITTSNYSNYLKIKPITYNPANPYKFYHPI